MGRCLQSWITSTIQEQQLVGAQVQLQDLVGHDAAVLHDGHYRSLDLSRSVYFHLLDYYMLYSKSLTNQHYNQRLMDNLGIYCQKVGLIGIQCLQIVFICRRNGLNTMNYQWIKFINIIEIFLKATLSLGQDTGQKAWKKNSTNYLFFGYPNSFPERSTQPHPVIQSHPSSSIYFPNPLIFKLTQPKIKLIFPIIADNCLLIGPVCDFKNNPMLNDSFYSFKILLVGNPSVGKSSILLRYADNIFHENMQSTIGVDLKLRTHTVSEQTVKLFVWDTAGQDKFKTIISAYYKGAKVIMFVFDVADQKSLEAVAQWEEEAEQHSNEEPIKILIGNKVDMDRKVTREQAEKFAAEHNMKYYETSAKRGSGIEGLFDEMAVELYDKYKKKPHKSTTDSGKKVRINIPNTKPVGKFSRCC